MRKIFKLLLLFMLAVTFVSCKDKKDVVIFGETEWYKPWLWSKYEPIIMERTFELEFNEDAKLWLKDTPLKFELRKKPRYPEIFWVETDVLTLALKQHSPPSKGTLQSLRVR